MNRDTTEYTIITERLVLNQYSSKENGFSCHELTVSHLTLGASTSERSAGCSTHAVILKKGKRCQIVKMVESLYTYRVFDSIWKYRMQRFSCFTLHAAGANFERRRHDLLGRPGRYAPPRKLDSLKYNFLRSLDRNWLAGKVF